VEESFPSFLLIIASSFFLAFASAAKKLDEIFLKK